MSDFPLLTACNAIFQSEGGSRLNLSALHQSFEPWERACWYQQSINLPHDKFGTHPEAVEEFLRDLPRASA